MKKMLLIILSLIILISLIAAGFVFWTTKTKQRFDVNTNKMSPLTSKTISLDEVNQIDLSIRTAVVDLSSGDTSKMELKNIAADQYQITQNEGTLKVAEKNFQQHHLEIGKSPVIKLTLSHRDLDRLKIDQLNGTLKINNLKVNYLGIHHHNGTTLVNNLQIINTSQLTKDNGSTTLNNLDISGLIVNVKTGQFKLNGKKQTNHYRQNGSENFTVNSGSGQVAITK